MNNGSCSCRHLNTGRYVTRSHMPWVAWWQHTFDLRDAELFARIDVEKNTAVFVVLHLWNLTFETQHHHISMVHFSVLF